MLLAIDLWPTAAEAVLARTALGPEPSGVAIAGVDVEVAPLVFSPPGASSASNATSNAPPYTPANIAQAYGFDNIFFPTSQGGFIKGDGAGQTIAIVIAYRQPNLLADLHAFDQQFGLPDPQVIICNQAGSTNPAELPPVATGNWGIEASLDVQWIHALAPAATLLVVEAISNGNANLYQAVDTARRAGTGNLSALPNVTVISMSWGTEDYPGANLDAPFSTPSGKAGVTFVASTGDDGLSGQYPATDPYVLAVGGTTLSINTQGNYGSETGWNHSSGGFSYSPMPTYQQGVQAWNAPNTMTVRMTPDVSFNGDIATGFYVYDSYDYPSAPWRKVGGTSAGAPCWAALIAIANQGRALNGQQALSGDQTLANLYTLYGNGSYGYAFHDVVSGSNASYSAGPGYDLVTGLGTPRANVVAAALAGVSQTPTTIAPTGVITTSTPTFQWSAIGGATSYLLTIVDSTTNTPVVSGLSTTNTSYLPGTPLVAGHGYSWYVQAADALGPLGPASAAVSFTIAAIHHAPNGADTNIVTVENGSYVFALADFGFSDPQDSPADNLFAVAITTLPGAGLLANAALPVAAGALVPASDIAAGRLTFAPAPNSLGTPYTSFTFQVQDDGSTNYGGANLDPVPNTITVSVLAPPQVDAVLVRGSSWTTGFLASLSAAGLGQGGFALSAGSAAQLAPLPWGSVDQIQLAFNTQVVVQQTSLALNGINVAQYSISGFSYDPQHATATWTLAAPLAVDRLTIHLASSGPMAVTDQFGNRLDGEWSDGTSAFPSGNATAGGDFSFAFNVLPADANRDGIVNGQDIALVASNWLTANAAGDVNADGIVNGQDIALVASSWLAVLPVPSGSSAAAALVVHSSASQQSSSDVVRALSVDPVGPHVDDKQPVKLVGWEDKAQSRQAHVRFSALAPTCVTGNATQQREAKSLPPVNRQGVSLPAGAVDAAIVNLAEFSARGRYQ